MKTLIIYASKTGTSEDVSKYLRDNIENCDILNINQFKPTLDEYDLIILGGGIFFKKLNKTLRDYIEKNQKLLLEKNIAFFYCCATISLKKQKKHLTKNFNNSLQNKAIIITCAGGKLSPRRANFPKTLIAPVVVFFYKLFNFPTPSINYDNLNIMINTLNEFLNDKK